MAKSSVIQRNLKRMRLYNNLKDLFLVREDQNRITNDLSIVLPKAC